MYLLLFEQDTEGWGNHSIRAFCITLQRLQKFSLLLEREFVQVRQSCSESQSAAFVDLLSTRVHKGWEEYVSLWYCHRANDKVSNSDHILNIFSSSKNTRGYFTLFSSLSQTGEKVHLKRSHLWWCMEILDVNTVLCGRESAAHPVLCLKAVIET